MHDAPLTNGVHLNGAPDTKLATLDAHDAADSPAIDSPATPVNDSPTPTVKIDVQYDDHLDSDVKHETVDMKVDIEEDASTAQAATPADTAAVDKASPPPSSQDVPMSEEPQSADVDMAEADAPAPSHDSTAPSSSVPGAAAVDPLATSSPYSTTSPNDDDIQPPPAKRARKHSDADQASLANTATPPPGSASPAPANAGEREASKNRGPPTLSSTQHRFCLSTIRTLRKLKAAIPFLQPVDPIALNVPTYLDVIKHPMDFSTIERKLHSSSPSKPDPNPSNPRYLHADEFVADVRLVFSNCVQFNGPDHVVTQMCKQVEEVFDRQMKNFPPAEPVKPPAPKKVATPPPPPPPAKKPAARRPSNAMPVIRRAEENGRPKREIHPPPPKDLPYAEVPKKMRKAKLPKDSGVAEQLRFCDKILKDLHKKIHYNIAHPFYEPVDWVALDIPSYPKIIKKPMDLSTMRKKLDNGDYPTADAFHNDFKLMMRNCMTFNPVGTPVNTAGQELQRLFDEKWKNLPQPRASVESDDEEEEDENSEDDAHARIVADMEARIAEMHQALAELKRSKSDVKKKEKKKERHVPQPVASTSKPPPKANGKPPVNRKKNTKRPISDDDVLSFEQKKELSDTIGKLDGSKLERVIQIIHEGVPEIRDSTEEIELEIDTLPAAVLTKLYNFVIRPNRAPPAKRARTGKGTGTGGLKRKSMDEDVEAEKIRVLEERMALFEKGGPVASVSHASAPTAGHDSDHSSDSSSDDSSGSDSE